MYHARYIITSMTFVRESSAEHSHDKQERFENLLNPIWNQLARYCNTVAGEHEAARDLMSETLLLAYQSFDRLRDPSGFKSYLFKIAVRVNYDLAKRAKRHTPLTEELGIELEQGILRDDGKAAERSLEVRELYEALKTLPDKQREAVVLFEVSGLSLKEIQDVQGGTLSGVKTRIVRAREELAKKLGVRNAKSDSITSPSTKKATSSPSQSFERALAFTMKAKL